MDPITPDRIIEVLENLRTEADKGVDALYRAEKDLYEKTLRADQIEASAFLTAEGSVSDRQAMAKLEALEARKEAEIARAVYNRVRTKLRHLEQTQSAVQTQARMVETTWRTS